MKHTQILNRSWNILWSYKALWVFGIILALTTASGGGGSSGGGGTGGGGGSSWLIHAQQELAQTWQDAGHGLLRLAQATQTGELEPWMIAAIVTFSLVGALIGVLFTIGHFVSQVALIRMVDSHESSGEKVSWRQGFRLGWSKAAWRLFLISFLIGMVGFLVFGILTGLTALPAILGSLANREAWLVLGILLTVGLAFPLITLAIAAAAVVSLVLEPVRRACVLEGLGVFESLRRGWQLVRLNFLDVGLMWVITLGIRLGVAVIAIPVAILLGMLALLAGGLLGGLVYLVTSAMQQGWIYGGVVGGLVFITVMALPLTFVNGLLQTYLSTTWTLTYRALKSM